MEPALALEQVSVSYGLVAALRLVSFGIPRGAVVAILGANGAGKSTLLRAASGMVRATGSIRLNGREVTGLPPHKIARLGVAHVLEGRGMLVPLSVEENLVIAAQAAGRAGAAETRRRLDEVYAMFPRVAERRRVASGLLSGGEQQMVAIGRAVMTNPDVLMLDEPSMGLAPKIVDEIYRLLRPGGLIREGRTILLAEQSATLGLEVADEAYVLAKGEIVAAGPAPALAKNPVVANAYLGIVSTDTVPSHTDGGAPRRGEYPDGPASP